VLSLIAPYNVKREIFGFKLKKYTNMKKIGKLIKKPFLGFYKLSRVKKIIVIVIVILITVGLSQYFANKNSNGYIVEKAKISSITEIVSETGNIETTGRADIYSSTDGIVEEIYIKNGDLVKKNQELFKVKSTATIQEQQAAYANYLATKTSLDLALATEYDLRSDMFTKWDRYRDMATSDEYEDANDAPKENERLAAEFQSTKDNWLSAEKKYKDSQTTVAKAQASVNSTWLLYQATQDSTVLAQADGTVSNLAVGTGSNVSAFISPAIKITPVLTIANFSKYTAKFLLNETDVYKVKPGQTVKLEADAVDNREYKGIVQRVDEIGTDYNGVIKYNVYVEITDPDEKLKFGMTIDADIITNKLDKVLTVPNSSVKPYENGKAVRIVNPQTKEVKYVPVVVGIKGTKETQIIKGISEGQEIITSLKNEQIKRTGMFGM